ncbi:hypothetical protein CBR_g31908 [Chara braunii]|uniref:Integrase catalytic domain-containing protein n=1 Tax=Chara braunii TaxID=69332 RepID=A0A388LFZ9_CHABU|nr:hypothetical protein CBR_g31908 [Chara braunii]|eukprot:GBG81236.1 hypothetical protein CBR_g31908 [Chara braunii]
MMDDYPMYCLLVGFSLWGTLWRLLFPLGFWPTFTCRVGPTRGGTSTTPYTKEEEEKMAPILKERKEKKEAKRKALKEEQAVKLKKIEEEMAREKERLKKEEDEKLKEVDEEEEGPPLQRKSGQNSGSCGNEMEKKISEWVANLSLGEEEEVMMYIPKDDQEAAMKVWDAEKDRLRRQALEDQQRMEWKLAMMREKKRRVDAASEAVKELEEVQKGHLRQVLEKLREANFKINAKKCDWAKTQVLYLGHVLDGDGVKPEDSKIVAIRDWPMPRTLTELCSFLGLANYYRKFVRNFSTIAAPLRKLLRKETIWKWDKNCTSAMKKLKQALIEYPVLKVVDSSLPFIVTTSIGVVLQQDDGNGYRPVEFMSARMPSEKVATSTYERELYALKQALDHWKHYLLGRHFKVYSDHETLRWLKTQAKMTPKLTRWAAEIDQYDFELKSVKGKYNVVADVQSRRADYFGAIVHYLDIGKDLQEKVREAYTQDPIYSDLLKKVKEAPETEPNYRTTEGLLFEKTNVFDRLCMPNSEEFRNLISGECHDTEGHFGWQKTLANLMRAYTWSGMKNDCVEYVRSCKVCQCNKSSTRAPLGLLRPLPIPDQPGDSVSIDFMDTQVKSRHGKSQVMVVVDRFSKYAVFVPLPSEAHTDLVIQRFFDCWALLARTGKNSWECMDLSC